MYHQTTNDITDTIIQTIYSHFYSIKIFYVDLLNEHTVEISHLHKDYYELYYCLEGSLDFRIEENAIQLHPGEFVIIQKNTEHCVTYEPRKKKSYFVLTFDIRNHANPDDTDEDLEYIKCFINAISTYPWYYLNDAYDCRSIIDLIIRECSEKKPGWHTLRRNLYSILINLIIRNFVEVDNSSNYAKTDQNLALKITQYLHDNYQNPNLDIDIIAKEFNLSSRQLRRIFEKHFSQSLAKTLNSYRINYTKNYLLDTNMSVEEIAAEVGFLSPSTLSRKFKESEGITISEYRKIYK